LQSAQATLAGLITTARTRAPATGRKVRLLVHADPANAERYLRHVALQLATEPGASPGDWATVVEVDLPEGIYIAPPSLVSAVGLVAAPSEWKRFSEPSADLVSDLFQGQSISVIMPGEAAAQLWTGVAFTPNGTLAGIGSGQPPKGYMVIVPGVKKPPGSFGVGESPVQLVRPHAVRGLLLSAYGVPAFLNDRTAF
jgi:hypothetical protein